MMPSMDGWGVPDTMEELDVLVAQVVTSADPYDVANQVCVCAMGATKTAEIAWDAYLVWAALTDVWEDKQDAEADALLRQAATEWIAAENDVQRHEYLDRWMYERLGYRRHVPKGWTLVVEQQSDGAYLARAEGPSGTAVTASAPDLETVWAEVERRSFALERSG
jgi:hypothetical protein